MLKPNDKNSITSRKSGRAVALKYDKASGAPIVIASGMGYTAERMVEVAEDNGVPIYEDNSLATMLSQLQLGQQIPPELYQAIVQIYVYFLNFDPKDPDKLGRERAEAKKRVKAEKEEEKRRAKEVSRQERVGSAVEEEEIPEPAEPPSLEDQMANLYGNDES